MGSFTQFDRPLRITTPLGPDALLLVALRGHEALSQLFHFELELLSPRQERPDFDKLLGQPVLAEVAIGGVRRHYHGIVRKFTQGRQDETFTYYRAELAPQLWLWTRRVQSRIFQQTSVPDVLRQVLDGLKYTLDLTATYPARDYCVQYRESDFAFASRLMEEEGMYYYFRHSEEGHELVITDSRFHAPDLTEPAALVYDPLSGGTRRDLRVNDWEKSQEVCSTRFTLRDYSFELPAQDLEAAETIQQTVKAGILEHTLGYRDELEQYDFPGGYAKRFDGVDPGGADRAADLAHVFTENKRTARVRMEAEAAESLLIRGGANAPHFAPGQKFTLMRHFDGDGAYLLTCVEHEARLGAGYRSSADQQGLEYHNRFTCLPADLQYRPQRLTPKPQIAGMQTATVVTPSGQEMFCDKYGRIKVQFPWDRQGQHDGRSSCWVRVAQVWAGKRWGAFFWPRVGHEVLVAFEEGDPDQPVVVGSLYNAANMPPFEMPSKSAGCGFKSCTVGGDAAEQYNSLVFYDQSGDEHLHLHSESHEIVTSESSRFRRTAGPRVEVMGSLFGLGSGGGGGMVEWPIGIGHLAGGEFAETYAHALPGSQTYVFGNNHTATMLGDSTSHTLGGASTTMVVDPEDMIFGAIFEHFEIPAVGALLSGVGGSTTLVAGANNALTYNGPSLSVTRGESLEYKTEHFWTDVSPVGIGVKLLSLLAAGTALAGDLCAALMAHTNEEGKKEIPEWATLLSTGLSSRILGLLVCMETENADVERKATRLADGKRQTDQAAALTLQFQQVSDAAKELVETAEDNLQSAITAASNLATLAGRTDRVLTSDYSLTAKNVRLTSRNPLLGRSALTLSAEGDLTGTNGFLHLKGSKQVLMQSGPAYVKCTKQVGGSKVNIGNATLGQIVLQQGAPNLGPAIMLDGTTQSLKLSVGPPGAGASIELSAAAGITIRFQGWSLTLGQGGITSTVGASSIGLTPASVEIKGPNVSNEATMSMQVKGGAQVAVQASGILQLKGAMAQIN